MDAIGLVMPQGTIVANPGSNTADGSTFDARRDSPPLDFAQLLAAGLMPQPPASGVAPPPPAPAEGAEVPPSTTAPAPSNDATAQTNPVAAAFLPTGNTERSASADSSAASHSKTGPASTLIAADGKAEPATANAPASVAAPAAIFADAASATTKAAGVPAASGAPADSAAIGEIAAPAAADTPRHAGAAHDVRANEQLSVASEAPAPTAHALSQPAPEPMAGARATAVLDVPAAVDTPEFAPALAQQVVWMADKDAQVAELRIDPPELGPVEVRLQLNGDEAAVQFVSAHAEVRSALEGAIARLRESLAQAGIQLGEASVGAESFRDSEHPAAGRDARGFARGRDGEHGWSDSLPAARVQRGLVDLFA